MDPINSMWTEKYRPQYVKDLVGDFKDKIKKHLENADQMQHLLLYSVQPGSGKTSLAKAIINELKADSLILNASDDRKIETVREKVNEFVKNKSSNPNSRRIVVMDEADGLTFQAQDALRNLMETYAPNALFILTCNHIGKVSDAIQSRCLRIDFSNPPKNDVKQYLKYICDNEGLEYTENGLDQVIESNYPSIRNCIQVLQSIYTEGKKVDENSIIESNEEYEYLWNKIVNEKDWKTVKNYVFQNNVDIQALNKYFWYKAVEASYIKLIQICATNEDKFMKGGEHLIIFVTSLTEMVK